MTKETRWALWGLVVVVLAARTDAASVDFEDGEFKPPVWQGHLFSAGSIWLSKAHFGFMQRSDGGNPGACQHAWVNATAPYNRYAGLTGFALNKSFVYDPRTSGAIDHLDFGFQVLGDQYTAPWQARVYPIIEQNGEYFRPAYPGDNVNANGWIWAGDSGWQDWTPNVTGSGLTAEMFYSCEANGDPWGVMTRDPSISWFEDRGSHPDFSATGAPITFGWGCAATDRDSASGADSFQFYVDNFSVRVHQVPEPASMVLLAFCGPGMLVRFKGSSGSRET